MILILLQTLIVLALAPAMVGLVRLFKARFQNRRGASILVPYIQLVSLLRKEMTITRHSSWVFRFVPFAVLASAAYLAAIVPTFALGVVPEAWGNIFLIAGVLTLGSVFLVWGGMDTSSTFGHMGSSREMTLASLIEPAMFVTLAGLATLAGTSGLDSILSSLAAAPWLHPAPVLLLAAALGLVALLENARYPVDNPATHLELTMVHEAMILEYSGPYLAMLEYASAIKLTILSLLFVNILLPFGLALPDAGPAAWGIAALVFIGKLIAVAFAIAFIESTIVKMRFYRMQEYATVAYLIALAGLIAAIAAITL